jgi:hypothetical protein
MYKFLQCGKNELKVLWTNVREGAIFRSGFHNTTNFIRYQNAVQRILPLCSPRNQSFVSDIDTSAYLEKLRKRNLPILLLLSSSLGLAVLLEFCSERPNGRFDIFVVVTILEVTCI